MPGCQRRTLHIQLGTIDGTQRLVQAQALRAVFRRLPRSERRQHLGGEGFVDLVEIEVLKCQAITKQ